MTEQEINKHLRPLSPKELREYRKTEPISERVSLALLREFLDDDSEKKIIEEEVIKEFKEFKYLFKEHLPHLF